MPTFQKVAPESYELCIRTLFSLGRFGIKPGLETINHLLEKTGNPHKQFRSVHIAGTNGKGSTAAFTSSILISSGIKTGLFTSPHLVRFNERISINNVFIPDSEVVELFNRIKKADTHERPATFFEYATTMAFLYFAENNAEIAVIEAGMGGRLDCTNAVFPEVSVITDVSIDHEQYLGDTLEKIASEKAGIIKPHVPVYYAQTTEESDSVIEKEAKKRGSFCKKIGKDAYEILGIEDKHIAFSCLNDYYGTTTWKLNNIGLYQPHNALLAMEVMRGLFGENGHPHLWKEALEAVRWRGRMEEVLPGVYVDGAHNISAVKAFAETVEKAGFADAVLFSAVRDKDYEEMIKYLCEHTEAACYIVTQIEDARGTRADELGVVFRKYTDKPVRVIGSVKDAFEYAVSSRRGGNVYCLGSLYLTGMIEGYLGSRENQIRGGR